MGGDAGDPRVRHAVWRALLVEARDRGRNIPQDVLARMNDWLARFAGTPASSLADGRMRAYAVYLLARQGIRPAAAISNVEQELSNRYAQAWPTDLAAAYLASTYRLMQRTADADRIMRRVPWSAGKKDFRCAWRHGIYYGAVVHDAQLLYLQAKHFPAMTTAAPPPVALEAMAPQRQSVRRHARCRPRTCCWRWMRTPNRHRLPAWNQRDREGWPVARADAARRRDAAGGCLGECRAKCSSPSGVSRRRTTCSPNQASIAGRRQPRCGRASRFCVTSSMQGERPHARDRRTGVLRSLRVCARSTATCIARSPSWTCCRAAWSRCSKCRRRPTRARLDRTRRCSARPTRRGRCQSACPASRTGRPTTSTCETTGVVLYGDANRNIGTFVYRVRANNAGRYQVPPAFAEGMYDRRIVALGRGSTLEVIKP